MSRALIPTAGHIIMRHGSHVLMIKRSIDVSWPLQWAFPGGKTENDELLSESAVRETQEETGVVIDPNNIIEHVILNARYTNGTRIYYFGMIEEWLGTPENIEPQKHDDLAWFPIDALPDKMVPHHRMALEALLNDEFYKEYDVNA